MKIVQVAAIAALLVGGAAGAQMSSHNGAELLVKGDYAAAERAIAQHRRLFPHDPDLLLNLATVYARTGRVDEARRTYRSVLARPDAPVDLAGSRVVRAHALATEGMRRLPAVLAAAP